MPRPIENPGSPDDYINGLRHKNPANSDWIADEEIIPVAEPDTPPQTVKGVDVGPFRPIQCIAYAAAFALGIMAGAAFLGQSQSGQPTAAPTVISSPVPQASPVPNRSPPSPALPESCQRALAGFSKYLDQASRVASATDQQLDIFDEAYQAILMKDYKKLNELSERQRRLDSTLTDDKVAVLPNYLSLKKDIEQCRSQSD